MQFNNDWHQINVVNDQQIQSMLQWSFRFFASLHFLLLRDDHMMRWFVSTTAWFLLCICICIWVCMNVWFMHYVCACWCMCLSSFNTAHCRQGIQPDDSGSLTIIYKIIFDVDLFIYGTYSFRLDIGCGFGWFPYFIFECHRDSYLLVIPSSFSYWWTYALWAF